jgi:hypothetical protein
MSTFTRFCSLVLPAAAVLLLGINSGPAVCQQTEAAPDRYFPGGTNDSRLFADFLNNTGEPSLVEIARKDPKAVCYRLDWIGVTSLRILTIRLSLAPDGSARITTIKASIDRWTEFHKAELTASADATKKFLKMVGDADFWSLPLVEPLPPPGPGGRRPYTMDGEIWLFEGARNGSYHVIYRHSPKVGRLTDMVQFLAKDLAKLNDGWIAEASPPPHHGTSIASATKLSPDRIDAAQAKALVIASLTPKQRRLPSLGVEPYRVPAPSKFLFLTVTWAGMPNGSVVVGNYAVDPYTGDVFSATSACQEEKNKHLKALQRKIRATLHLTKAEYKKLKTKGPLCGE